MPQKRYALKSIEIVGFRGYREPPMRLDFGAQANLFFGANRSGKTSTMTAVEWVLFGKFAAGATIFKGDEPMNDFSQSARVVLELSGPDGMLEITRTKNRESKYTLTVTTPDGIKHTGSDAQKTIYWLLGLEFDDFTRAVYLHQEDIRDLITGKPNDRSAAMDRLLGLDQLRNISEGLATKNVRSAISKIQQKYDIVVKGIEAKIGEAKTHLSAAVKNAADTGLTESCLSLSAANEISGEIFGALDEVSEGTGIEVRHPDLAKSHTDLRAHVKTAKDAVSRIRKHLPGREQFEKLSHEQVKLIQLKELYASALTRYNLAAKSVEDFKSEHGDETSITGKIAKIDKRVQELNAELKDVGAKEKVIKYGLDYLGEFVDVRTCPICNREFDREDIIEHLRKEVEEKVGAKLREIDREIKARNGKKDQLGELIKRLSSLHDEKRKADEDLNEKTPEIAKALGQPVDKESALSALEKKIGELEQQINKLKRPLEAKEGTLEDIELKVNQLLAIAEVLGKQQRLEKLHGLQGNRRLKNIERTLIALGAFEHKIDMVADAVSEVMTKVAPEKVRRAMPAIKKIYTFLVGHPSYPELLIKISPSTRGSLKNVYDIKATNPTTGAEAHVKYKFSTGDMNCTALSVFLGLAEQDAYSHRADFLIIDDPSQNLDPERIEKLAEKLAEIAGKKQLIVASQEPSFQKVITQKLNSKQKQTFRFKTWGVKGVKVQSS